MVSKNNKALAHEYDLVEREIELILSFLPKDLVAQVVLFSVSVVDLGQASDLIIKRLAFLEARGQWLIEQINTTQEVSPK